ncbi:sperm acrosome developmental regulator [Hyla sarda]|uniref:sperm acrosome developmental regulator n=1 Tax=Hyla sarda TaxID=327740 RepID=UPI0024C277D9|nr:sperm acrosome developmental regulator [Hyla sarda]
MSGGKKRSGFQITSVTTDYQPSSPISPIPAERSPSPPNGPRSPPTSRFRLVRLDPGPLGGGRRYQKGRWTCVDFYNLEVGAQHRAGAGHSLDSGLPRSAPASPLLLSPGGGAKGQQAPRSQGAPVFGAVTDMEPTAQLTPPPLPVTPRITSQDEVRPNRPMSDVFNERLLLARSVFSIDESEIDSTSNSTGAIDNKIEQAMDLVKTHLLFAVREEVEALREQIKDLTERNSVLEHENSLLRTLATPQQLSELSARIQASRKPL